MPITNQYLLFICIVGLITFAVAVILIEDNIVRNTADTLQDWNIISESMNRNLNPWIILLIKINVIGIMANAVGYFYLFFMAFSKGYMKNKDISKYEIS